ncbi:hypothetical protein ACS0TY_015020 [Phlomoides rotata]
MVKDPENVWHASMGGRFRREDEIPLYSWHNLWQGKWKRHSDHSYDIGEVNIQLCETSGKRLENTVFMRQSNHLVDIRMNL